MNGARIESLRAGSYRLHFRPGQGRPLLIIHPSPIEETAAWFGPSGYDDRPLAVMSAREMERFDSDADEVVRALLAATGWQDAADLQVLGFSTGGYAAILYAAMMSVLRPAARISVLAFSPMICVWPPEAAGWRVAHHERVVAAGWQTPTQRRNLERFGDTRPWVRKAVSASDGRFRAAILHPARNARDVAQASLLTGMPGVTVAALPTAQHTFYTLLTLKRGHANSVARIQLALTRKGRMTPEEALPRATALHAALADAAAAAPDLLSLYAMPRPAPIGGEPVGREPAIT
ncbi:dienelactone hydrolase family protein [Falsiroseomonas stagni]|uniref:Uncharacterized protein n=1 Tax=Falsiroseomonas stagni DSM 19981 TaxID=1123062 RepID=A0A1I4D153_9PROT|nr:hypothetical protein [Falsiroseomonas stagni]SFK87278.1 hypothetical protein SAMN02745775_10974 [Falsiroseomonas stagni DSM 19981]